MFPYCHDDKLLQPPSSKPSLSPRCRHSLDTANGGGRGKSCWSEGIHKTAVEFYHMPGSSNYFIFCKSEKLLYVCSTYSVLRKFTYILLWLLGKGVEKGPDTPIITIIEATNVRHYYYPYYLLFSDPIRPFFFLFLLMICMA